ncbi:hypothetical protein B7494_g6313, partial [Chlorociboria aeruginascens]
MSVFKKILEQYPPVEVKCQEQVEYEELTGKTFRPDRVRTTLAFSKEFQDRFGTPFTFMSDFIYISNIDTTTFRIPHYRTRTLLNFVKNRKSFTTFCTDIDSITKPQGKLLGRTEKECAWYGLIFRRFEREEANLVLYYTGRHKPDLAKYNKLESTVRMDGSSSNKLSIQEVAGDNEGISTSALVNILRPSSDPAVYVRSRITCTLKRLIRMTRGDKVDQYFAALKSKYGMADLDVTGIVEGAREPVVQIHETDLERSDNEEEEEDSSSNAMTDPYEGQS